MPTAFSVRMRTVRAVLMLGTVFALSSCLGELASPRGAVGEAAIDLRGLRSMSQVANDTSDEVQSALFKIFALAGTTRREVASRLFTSKDLDVIDTDTGTVFKLSFPYISVDDRFEVLGYGFSARGDTLYRVGPVTFTMSDASRQGSQNVVAVVVPPEYVGPGRTAAKLTISPRPVNTVEGKTTAVTATLTDASGKVLTSPTFRFRWHSLDGSIARFEDGRIGLVTGGPQPGFGRLVAVFEPTGLVDTVGVFNTVPVAELRVINGNNQTGRVSAPLSSPVTVQAWSAGGRTFVPGAVISVVVSQGGGSVSSSTITTGQSNGAANVSWTLGPAVGTQTLTFSYPGVPSQTATATATAATASASQSKVSVLPTAIQTGGEEATVTVTLRDAGGNPVPNTVVTFSGSSAAIFASTTGTTNASGVATTRVHASVAGSLTIIASVNGQTVGSVTLAAGTRVGTPASIAIETGNNQSVRAGQDFPQLLTVVVRDAAGAPVPGALVDWSTTTGDGRKLTDATGRSSANYALPANWTAASGTVTVTVTGTSLSATFVFAVIP